MFKKCANFTPLAAVLLAAIVGARLHAQTATDPDSAMKKPADRSVLCAKSLFDGKKLAPWEQTEFGGEGECVVRDGEIIMSTGDPFTAINLPEDYDLPTTDYEIEIDAQKIEGTDFFCTVTFPVDDSFCSLVVGGWGGTLVGLSSIDGLDASENETRRLKKFKSNQWYNVRIRVRPNSIVAWIDGERLVDQNITGKKITIRNGVIPCRPLGIASYITSTGIKKIELKRLKPETK